MTKYHRKKDLVDKYVILFQVLHQCTMEEWEEWAEWVSLILRKNMSNFEKYISSQSCHDQNDFLSFIILTISEMTYECYPKHLSISISA